MNAPTADEDQLLTDLEQFRNMVAEQEREMVEVNHTFARGYYTGYRQGIERAIALLKGGK